jgi:magnesium-transporting ATPase (P-type)
VLAYAILAVGAVLFAFGVLVRGYALDEIFLTVIGFAVAAIPEGLPAVITIILALGVQRMARRGRSCGACRRSRRSARSP